MNAKTCVKYEDVYFLITQNSVKKYKFNTKMVVLINDSWT